MLTSATVRNPVDVLVLAAAAAAAAATAGAAAAAAAAAACCEYEINVREQNKSAPHTYVNKGSPHPSPARLLRNSLPPSLPSSTSTGKKNGVGRAPTAEGIYGTTRDTTTRTAESCVRGGGIDPTHPYTKVLGLLYPHLSATITSSRHLYKWGGRAAVSTFWGTQTVF